MVISWCVAWRTKVSTFLPVSWECPGRPSGHVVGSSQDPNINLPLYLFPADQPWCLVCSRVFPSLAVRWRRRRRRWKGKSLFSPAAAPSSLIDVILSCRGAAAWKHTRDWKSAADVFTHTSYVPFPCGRSPEPLWLPCALRGPHHRLCRQRRCALSQSSNSPLQLRGGISYCMTPALLNWLTRPSNECVHPSPQQLSRLTRAS